MMGIIACVRSMKKKARGCSLLYGKMTRKEKNGKTDLDLVI